MNGSYSVMERFSFIYSICKHLVNASSISDTVLELAEGAHNKMRPKMPLGQDLKRAFLATVKFFIFNSE